MHHHALLITGGAGFVGSNLALSFKKSYPAMRVMVMDNLKRRGSELNLPRLKAHGVEFHHGDIRCPEDFPADGFDAMVECSAEPSVLAGLDGNPLYVVNTNLNGTVNCLEQARKHRADVVFISTSRVYPHGALNALAVEEGETRFAWKDGQQLNGWSSRGVAEDFPLSGARSLYGASKLCSEYLLQEYLESYGVRGVINRFGVLAGPWQFGKVDQGVFTLWMAAHYFRREGLKYIGYRGTGKQVRDLLHVDDAFRLIDTQLSLMERLNGQIFNAGGGPDCSLSLAETTALCRELTGNALQIGGDPVNRPADLAIYLTDNRKVESLTGWRPQKGAREILTDIRDWIGSHEAALRGVL